MLTHKVKVSAVVSVDHSLQELWVIHCCSIEKVLFPVSEKRDENIIHLCY